MYKWKSHITEIEIHALKLFKSNVIFPDWALL
jgi:hypothetical protein